VHFLGNTLARSLGLLENAVVTYICTPRWIIDYVYFNKAHKLKRGKNGKIVMMYKDYTNQFELLDRNLSLYVVESFVFNLQKREKSHARVPLPDSHIT
jgi:hypothetical protein